MIKIGEFHKLKVLRRTTPGIFLGDNDGEEVLLPNKYCKDEMQEGDEVEVFVYRDFEERKVAVTDKPKILLNGFGFLKVTDVSSVGAFLDWGMEKELMVPFSEQRQKMEKDRWYVVYLDIDKKTDRLFASNKIEKYLKSSPEELKVGQEVDILIYGKSELGFSVIVNDKFRGLIFAAEVYDKLNIGERRKAYIRKIRPDNKLDISLQAVGYKNYVDSNAAKILEELKKNNGFLRLNDDSAPEEIYKTFSMSKKAFKKSLGALYKQEKVRISHEGIWLTY